ncbi:MAG: arginine:ornithine antiporter, partial [Cardiobacterium sp.]
GVGYLLLSVLLYVPGVALFLYAQTRFHGRFPRLQAGEIALLALLLLLLVPALQQVLADLRGAG